MKHVLRQLLVGAWLSGGGGLLPFSDDFARADGALGNGWEGATWAIVSGKAVNTLALGAELLTDPGLEDWASASDLTNWTENIAGTSTIGQETSIVHGGSNAAKFVIDGSNSLTFLDQTLTHAIDVWLRGSFWGRSGAGAPTVALVRGGGISAGAIVSLSTVYQQFISTIRVPGANQILGVKRQSATAMTLYFDDISFKVLTLASLFATRDFGRNDVDASVNATIVTSNAAGVVVNLDSAATPANFVIAYHDGASIKLEKCVAGVYTTLISTAVAYSAGAAVRVVKSGPTTYQLFYADVQRGADQTVSDAGIVSNTFHGCFSTFEGNSLDDFSIAAV